MDAKQTPWYQSRRIWVYRIVPVLLFVLMLSLGIQSVVKRLTDNFAKYRVSPAPAAQLSEVDYPFGETGSAAWLHTERHSVALTTMGAKGASGSTIGTFLRHRSLEPQFVLCVRDLGYTPNSPGPFPIPPPHLLLLLGQPWAGPQGMILAGPAEEKPHLIELTGDEAIQFLKNGPTQKQIDELLAARPFQK